MTPEGVTAYRVLVVVKSPGNAWLCTLNIDPNGIEDPTLTDEFLLVKKQGKQRIGFFRNEEWIVQGRIDSGAVVLFKDDPDGFNGSVTQR